MVPGFVGVVQCLTIEKIEIFKRGSATATIWVEKAKNVNVKLVSACLFGANQLPAAAQQGFGSREPQRQRQRGGGAIPLPSTQHGSDTTWTVI